MDGAGGNGVMPFNDDDDDAEFFSDELPDFGSESGGSGENGF